MNTILFHFNEMRIVLLPKRAKTKGPPETVAHRQTRKFRRLPEFNVYFINTDMRNTGSAVISMNIRIKLREMEPVARIFTNTTSIPRTALKALMRMLSLVAMYMLRPVSAMAVMGPDPRGRPQRLSCCFRRAGSR